MLVGQHPGLSSGQNLQDWQRRIESMFAIDNAVLWVLGVMLLAVVILALRHHFSPEAREARRRTRSHGPVISKKRGPSIRLAVNPKERRKRK